MKPGLFLILSLILLTSVCDTISQLNLKSVINSLGVSVSFDIRRVFYFITRLLSKPRLLLTLLFSTLSLCIWLFVLSRVDLNYAFSADSMHYILIALASRLILKEKLSRLRWLGTALIVIGIILVSID